MEKNRVPNALEAFISVTCMASYDGLKFCRFDKASRSFIYTDKDGVSLVVGENSMEHYGVVVNDAGFKSESFRIFRRAYTNVNSTFEGEFSIKGKEMRRAFKLASN